MQCLAVISPKYLTVAFYHGLCFTFIFLAFKVGEFDWDESIQGKKNYGPHDIILLVNTTQRCVQHFIL